MCKMAHFGNCDPETADQEYCIFHKPNKTEEEAREFWEKFLKRFKPRVEEIEVEGKKIKRLVFEEPVDAGGFVFPEVPSEGIEYKNSSGEIWKGKSPFEHAIFENHVIFYKATFEGNISFENSTFKGFVCFDKAHFMHFVSFDNSTFTNQITADTLRIPFREVLIVELDKEETGVEKLVSIVTKADIYFYGVHFHNGASFYKATFRGVVDFRNAKFEVNNWDELYIQAGYYKNGLTGAIFNRAKFIRPVVFSDSEFKWGAEFWETKFRWVDFSKVKFLNEDKSRGRIYVRFEDATFELGADFSGSKLEDSINFAYAKIFKSANFRNVEIRGGTNSNIRFGGAVLENAIFEGSKFDAIAEFHGVDKQTIITKGKFVRCIFNQQVTFYRVIFEEETTFAHSIFKDNAAFDSAEFRGNTIFDFSLFEKGASFKNATFYDEARFRETKFREPVEFHDTVFIGNAKFESTFFESIAEFSKALFLQSTDFNGAIFNNKADFKRAFFNGNVIFRNTSFGLSVDFSEKPTEEELKKVLSDVRLRDKLLSKKIQINVGYKFGEKIDFSHASVTAVKFFNKEEANLELSNSVLEEFVNLFRLPESMIEASRIQRVSFEKEGKRDEADRMFVLEMRAKIRARLKNSKTKLEKLQAHVHNFVEWLLADLPSEYGTNWVRLFLISLLVILGNAVPYTIWSNLIKGFPETSSYLLRFANALYYSLVTFTTLGYGDMHPTGWLKALSALEALTGAVFMALIVAVIARKWMR